MSRPGRHKTIQIIDIVELPEWFDALEDGSCLRSVAEDAFTAKAWADKYGASMKLSCSELYNAGMKSLAKMGDKRLSAEAKAKAGTRAARKFWEAKVCVRRAR